MMRATRTPPTIFNFMAFFAIIAVTTILIVGIKESANFNTTIVFVKLIAVIVFIIVASMYVIKRPNVAHANWAVVPAQQRRVFRLVRMVRCRARCGRRLLRLHRISTQCRPRRRKRASRRGTCPSASSGRS